MWERLLDPRVSFTTEDGDLKPKRDMVGNVRPLPKTISGKITVTEFKATVHGDVAVTTHVDDEQETFHGHGLHCQYRTTDTWKKTPAGWRLIASQVSPCAPIRPRSRSLRLRWMRWWGSYALAPELHYEIRRSGNVLTGQESGRRLDTLLAETRDVLSCRADRGIARCSGTTGTGRWSISPSGGRPGISSG